MFDQDKHDLKTSATQHLLHSRLDNYLATYQLHMFKILWHTLSTGWHIVFFSMHVILCPGQKICILGPLWFCGQ